MNITVDLRPLIPLIQKLGSISTPSSVNTDKMVREVATTLCAEMVERIHEKGLKADGTPIGQYDPKYIKKRVKKGFSSSNKVVLAYERQMQNDFTIGVSEPIKTEDGYGLGFQNPHNADKAEWMRLRYGNIYGLTEGEQQIVPVVAEGFIAKLFSKKVA